jgi:hypothetical protein
MRKSFTVELFHGLLEGGERHVSAVLRDPTGRDETMLAELGADATPAEQVSALISALTLRIGKIEHPTRDVMLRLTAGDRERLVLAICSRLIGAQVDLVAACNACGAIAETPFRFDDVVAMRPEGSIDHERAVDLHGSDGRWTARCRPPTGAELEKAARGGPDAARNLTVDCILALTAPDGCPVAAGELPRDFESTVAEVLAAFDPAAECRITMDCPSCGERIDTLLDGHTILRTGLGGARQVYQDVYRMAHAYHWSEAEILSLPMHRRRLYLTIADGAEGRR